MAELTEADKKAKANLDRQAKINQAYRDYEELKALQSELDSIAVKKDVNMTDAEFKSKVVNPLKQKVNKAKNKLRTTSNTIKNSGDKKLVNEFNEFAKKEGIDKVVKSSSSKTSKPMAKNTNTESAKSVQEKYNKLNSKAKFYKLKYGKDSKEYQEAAGKANFEVARYVLKNQNKKKAEYEKRLENAIKSDDYDLATQIETERKNWDDSRFKFEDNIEKNYVSRELDYKDFKKTPSSFDKYDGTQQTSLRYDNSMLNEFNNYVKDEVKNIEQEEGATVELTDEEVGKTPAGSADKPLIKGGAQAVGTTSGGSKKNVDDYFPSKDDPIDYKYNMEKAKKARDDAYALANEQDEFNFEYGPDSESGLGDTLGNLVDVGRGVVGMIGANEEIPEYQRGRMFSQATDEATRMRDMGLSADELAMRERGVEEAAAYGMKNVARGVAGSAGAYLGNVGNITSQMMKAKGDIASQDEAMRRNNRQNFQNMALRDEAVNRQIFQDDLRQAEMTKQAGAGLVQDAVSNIKDRADWNKNYGKGSLYYQYMKDRSRDAQSNAFYREQNQKNLLRKYQTDADADYEDAKNAYEKNNTLTADPKQTEQVIQTNKAVAPAGVEMEEVPMNQDTDALGRKSIFKRGSTPVSNQEAGSNLSPEEEAMNQKIAEQGESKKARADKIEKLMMETDDEDELMRLSDEFSKLKL